jgi:hypothetical protein
VRTVEFVILTFDKVSGRDVGRCRLDRRLLLVLVFVVVSGGGDPIAKDGIQIVLDFVVVLFLLVGSGVTDRTGALFVLIFVVGLIRFIGTSRVIFTRSIVVHLVVEVVEVVDIQLNAVFGRVA